MELLGPPLVGTEGCRARRARRGARRAVIAWAAVLATAALTGGSAAASPEESLGGGAAAGEEDPAPRSERDRRPDGGRMVFPVRGSHSLGAEGARFGAHRGGRAHQGQDVMAACGTPLVAAASGVVTLNRFHGLAGHYLVIDGAGHDFVYMHLASPSPLALGTAVRAGQPIGVVGATGNARGCHLHFEAWTDPGYHKGGAAVDPLPLLRRGS